MTTFWHRARSESTGSGRVKLDILRARGPVAQAVEHLPFKQRVAGSSPARLTKAKAS